MCFGYYWNFSSYYELGRGERVRRLGTSYSEIERNGVMLTVLELKCKYIKPGYYDEEVTITVRIKEKPTMRIKFDYEIHNEKEELINVGETTLVFVDTKRNRPDRKSVV